MRRHGQSLTGAENALYEFFSEHSSELYRLAFLLTGDPEQSVQSLGAALEVEDVANPFFRDWMASWARKLVIAAALGVIAVQLRESARRVEQSQDEDSVCLGNPPTGAWTGFEDITNAEFERAVLAVDVFPRCALLLTIFEKLSIQDAAVLLGVDETLVRKAQYVGLIEFTRNLALGRGWNRECVPPCKWARHLRAA